VIRPSSTAAVQIELSSVYTPVPETLPAVPFAGQPNTNSAPMKPAYAVESAFQPVPPSATPAVAALADTSLKLPENEPYELLVMPLPVEPLYEPRPGRTSIATLPPPASVIRPSNTAAVHTELSYV
jgi:hypothetical protein